MAAHRWPHLVLAFAALAFALVLRAAIAGHDFVEVAPVLAVTALAIVAIGAGVLAVWALAPDVRAIGAAGAAALTVALALLAATPIDFTYDDGCNDHQTVAPLALVPALALLHPDRAVGAYEDFSTVMACFRTAVAVPQ